MSVRITDYRGFEIFFDEDIETFYATSDGSPSCNNKNKISFSSLKKELDQFIQDSQTFEPFEAISTPSIYNDGRTVKIIGIRKDGRFVYEYKGKKEQLSDYDDDKYILANPENEKPYAAISLYKLQIDELNQRIKEEEKKIIRVTLKEVKTKILGK